jgi:hypothetical protein
MTDVNRANGAARRARVTGVDISPVALRKAAALGTECRVEVDWIEAG